MTIAEHTVRLKQDFDDVYAAGKESQRLEWWRKYLNRGNAISLAYAFAYNRWSDGTFDPPYNINASSCSNLFANSYIADLRGILTRNGVELIFDDSKTSNNQFFNLFTYSRIEYAPYLKLPTTCSCYGWFTGCSYLIEVDGYECTEIHTFQQSNGNSKTFQGCTNLVKIIFHGTIANDINLQWSNNLSLESLVSLFSCLKNFIFDADNAFTKTVTLSAESWALTETEEFMNVIGVHGRQHLADIGWNWA